MALATQLDISLAMTETGTADFGTPTSRVLYSKSVALTTGTGLNQADMRWSDQRTLGGSANEDLDLAGSLTGALGNTLTFARIKGLLIYSIANNVTISRPTSNGVPFLTTANTSIVIAQGGLFLWVSPNAAGVVVTPGTGDLINISAGVGGCTYDIHVFGASA